VIVASLADAFAAKMAARRVQLPDPERQFAVEGAPSDASLTVIETAAPAVDCVITFTPTMALAPNAMRATPASNRAIRVISSTFRLFAWCGTVVRSARPCPGHGDGSFWNRPMPVRVLKGMFLQTCLGRFGEAVD
jgi:hypothetical protein